MNVKDIINKIKEFISKKILDFKALSKTSFSNSFCSSNLIYCIWCKVHE